ncbi:phage tail tube protein [Bacillota bacterium Lsc_1132]
MAYNANEIINGLFGTVYDENGQQLQSTQSFESKLEFNKEEKTIPGKLMKGNKITSMKGTGSMALDHIDTRLQKKIAENPTGKYNYIGKLADPTSRGEEAVLFVGLSFDGTPLLSFNVEELGKVELDFTFDDFKFLNAIE